MHEEEFLHQWRVTFGLSIMLAALRNRCRHVIKHKEVEIKQKLRIILHASRHFQQSLPNLDHVRLLGSLAATVLV